MGSYSTRQNLGEFIVQFNMLYRTMFCLKSAGKRTRDNIFLMPAYYNSKQVKIVKFGHSWYSEIIVNKFRFAWKFVHMFCIVYTV